MFRSVCFAVWLVPAGYSLAGFVNASVTFQQYYPDTASPFLTPQTAVVGPGVEFTAFLGVYRVDLSDTAVSISFDTSNGFSGFGSSPFNGFTVTGAGVGGMLSGLAVDSSTTLSGFDASRLSFTANSFSVNLQGLDVTPSSGVRVNATFAGAAGPAVAPLPAPVACGVAMLGGLAVCKRRRGRTA